MNPALIAAIAAGLGSVIGVVGKVIVDVIKAKHEPDQADLELKDELAREKEKNDAAIEAFTDFGKIVSIRKLPTSLRKLKNIEVRLVRLTSLNLDILLLRFILHIVRIKHLI